MTIVYLLMAMLGIWIIGALVAAFLIATIDYLGD